ncbi:hypothetical protein V6B08_15885 [Ferrovibrio sp. MS7]|uniref:hypothetical protein n=1 Tax=Ferrovibrio plantarum TaxID=3119164 RepID=UPI003136CB89
MIATIHMRCRLLVAVLLFFLAGCAAQDRLPGIERPVRIAILDMFGGEDFSPVTKASVDEYFAKQGAGDVKLQRSALRDADLVVFLVEDLSPAARYGVILDEFSRKTGGTLRGGIITVVSHSLHSETWICDSDNRLRRYAIVVGLIDSYRIRYYRTVDDRPMSPTELDAFRKRYIPSELAKAVSKLGHVLENCRHTIFLN